MKNDGKSELHCIIVGWLGIGSDAVSFKWTTDAGFLEFGGEYIEGSGAEVFLQYAYNFRENKVDSSKLFESLSEIALYMTGILYINEVKYGNTLSAGFGGGYDVFVFSEGKFRIVDDVTYLLFSVRLNNMNECSIIAYPSLIKTNNYDDYSVVYSIIGPSFDGMIKPRDGGFLGVVRPLVKSYSQFTKSVSLSLESRNYVLVMTGKTIVSTDESFIRVITDKFLSSQFKINISEEISDGIHKITFDLPNKLMNDTLIHAFLAFSRQTVVREQRAVH